MGELPQHEVMVLSFSIGTFPVTVAEYACLIEAVHFPQPLLWVSQLKALDNPAVDL